MGRHAFEDEQLLLVDDSDRVVGHASKGDCHLGSGRTHRAFSAVVVDTDQRVLLARRASDKPLWPGHWDATVASHPRASESYADAARRRIVEELGAEVTATLGRRFRYRIAYESIGVEDELCAALVAVVDPDTEFAPVATEIDAVEWVTLDDLTARLDGGDATLCPWLPLTLLGLANDAPQLITPALQNAARSWLERAPFEGEWFLLPA
ncbi:MAG: isopentenyl-diphosphate Delta-isomerase [Planctomycetota bacterium]|jgi:isopentenyl-diphosphate delta-isomerase